MQVSLTIQVSSLHVQIEDATSLNRKAEARLEAAESKMKRMDGELGSSQNLLLEYQQDLREQVSRREAVENEYRENEVNLQGSIDVAISEEKRRMSKQVCFTGVLIVFRYFFHFFHFQTLFLNSFSLVIVMLLSV